MIVHVWDPYHGDPNHRFQRLGNLRPRHVPRSQWRTFASIQPALYGNGLFADLGACDSCGYMTRHMSHDQRAQTSIVNNNRREISRRSFGRDFMPANGDRRDIARRAFSLEPEPQSE